MRLLLLNGNSNVSMTEQMAGRARELLGHEAEIVADTATDSVAYIGSRRECALAGAALVPLVERHLTEDPIGFDAILLACFGEPGIAAVREISPVPVVGMLEASLLTAIQLGERFSIITPGERWPRMIEDGLHGLGLTRRCLGINAIVIDDLRLPDQREQAGQRLAATLEAQYARLAPDVVIIGGAAFAGLAPDMPRPAGCRLLDCFEAAVMQCQALMCLQRLSLA
ncbi:hydrogenase expression protein HupH [Halomonas sp. DQ26W]|uniref:aspartate/glutamate racemase family protein n=1 Tax=Halomonas sp. DQ26W TaxID=2282311 RepID=UPI000DF79302|nr:aspartate/glutamate racemase family protein [Halomonas sp. DQ26W]RDB42680.1 hydrogenase expression protein HupH [Halomonas sp. DQ26W]